ncbi:MAG TPA: hypothetical protein VJ179_01350 [Patescibacteria group bacterium]|nr:hypothetical protein [Patescibacteria group bacterium]
MEEVRQGVSPAFEPEITLSGRVSQAFRLFLAHWKPFLLYPIVLTILIGIVAFVFGALSAGFLVLGGMMGMAQSLGGWSSVAGPSLLLALVLFLLFMSVLFVAGALLSLVIIYAVSAIHKGKEPEFGEMFSYGLSHLSKYLGVYWYVFKYTMGLPLLVVLVSMILSLFKDFFSFGVAVGTVWLVVQALVRGPRVFAALYIAVDEDKKALDAVNSSIELTKGRWTQTAGNLFVFSLAAGIVLVIVVAVLETILSVFGKASSFMLFRFILQVIPNSLFQTAFTSLMVIFTYLLYKLYQKEQTKVEEPKPSSVPQPQPPQQSPVPPQVPAQPGVS